MILYFINQFGYFLDIFPGRSSSPECLRKLFSSDDLKKIFPTKQERRNFQMHTLTKEQKLENLKEILVSKKQKLLNLQKEVENIEAKVQKLEAKKE